MAIQRTGARGSAGMAGSHRRHSGHHKSATVAPCLASAMVYLQLALSQQAETEAQELPPPLGEGRGGGAPTGKPPTSRQRKNQHRQHS